MKQVFGHFAATELYDLLRINNVLSFRLWHHFVIFKVLLQKPCLLNMNVLIKTRIMRTVTVIIVLERREEMQLKYHFQNIKL